MDWRAIWRRWWQGEGRLAPGAKRPSPLDPKRVEDWEARIVAAGIAPEWAARLAPRLAESQRELGRGSAQALIRGAAHAMALQGENQTQVERSLRDVREVERLLGAFTGELAKLDEVLEVLAAYAQRMRPQKPNGSNGHLLH
ncbi:MAG: hypothetical protein K2X91_15650 [Thermoleophilia bacterium]|nr:hypothetical protein [Thermoleophilia bacterium]